jgi:hypothetical protein
MILNTKFDLLQEVWVMLRAPARGQVGEDNIMVPFKPDCRQIHGISHELYKNEVVVTYHLEKYRGLFRCDYKESEVFATQEELIAHHNKEYPLYPVTPI